MQYVILMYMKHLGVKVKEPRNLEHKRGRIGFLPKIKVGLGTSAFRSLCFFTQGRSAFLRLHIYRFSKLVLGVLMCVRRGPRSQESKKSSETFRHGN